MTPLCVIGETVVRQSRDDVVAVCLGGSDMNVRVANKGDNTGRFVVLRFAIVEALVVVNDDQPRELVESVFSADPNRKKVRRHG
jgi:hypothetical protein